MHVHEPGPVRGRRPKLRFKNGEGSRRKVRLRAGQVDEVGSVDGHGPNVVALERGPERGQFGRRPGAALPRGRIVGKDLERRRPDGRRSIRGTHHATAEGQMGADPGLEGRHRDIVRCGP